MRGLIVGALLVAGASARAKPAAYHPPAIKVALACTSGDHRVVDGDRTPIDHDVTCKIDGIDPIDGDDTPAITASVEQPLGGRADTGATMSLTTGSFTLGSDLLRCAATTFHATLSHGDRVTWQETLHVRPSCPRVELRRPAVACRQHQMKMECTVTVAGAPEGANLEASFRRSTDPDDVDREPVGAADGGGLAATASYSAYEQPCHPIRVDAVIAHDGGVVWTGRTSYKPGCHPPNP